MTQLPTLENMRFHGVRRLRVYCINAPRCSHSTVMNVDFLPDDTVVKSIDHRMVCTRCGVIGADVRPDWPAPYGN